MQIVLSHSKKKSSNPVKDYAYVMSTPVCVCIPHGPSADMNKGEDTRDTCPPVKRMKLGEEEDSETHTKGLLVY